MKRPDTGCDDAAIALKRAGPVLSILHDACELVEARCLHYKTDAPRTALGAPADVEAKAAEFNGDFFNAYHTINPINPEFRGKNASDDDIARIRWVPYDIDPVRRGPDGLVLKGKHSATDEEKAEAWKVAEAIAAFWRARGYDPLLMDSGNGYYVLVPADMSPDNSLLVERLLKAHAATFSTRGAAVDQSTFNPSRILAVPGTVKRKGEDTLERPWRFVRLLHPGSRDEELDADTLAQLLPPEPMPAAVPAPAPKPKPGLIPANTIEPEWVEGFLRHSCIAHGERRPYRKGGKSGWKWVLSTKLDDWCPNQDAHASENGPSTQVAFIDENGVLGFQCSHSKCGDFHWRQFRDYHEQRNAEEGRGRFREEWVETNDSTIVLRGAWLNEAVQHSEAALIHEKSLRYYRRGQDLVKPVSFDRQQKVAGLNRKLASVVVQEVSDESIRRDLAQCCSFMQPVRGNNGKVEKLAAVNPPRELSAHIRDRARSGEAGYDVLDMVTTSPCLLADGTVLDAPGYRERVLFLPGNLEYPRVPEQPTEEDAKAALAKFAAIYREFPFVVTEEGQKCSQTSSYSAVLAALLSLVARPAIPTVPLFGITAVTAGTGKTKIAESASIAALGYAPTSVSFGDDVEFTKALVPLLREADRAILIDNVSLPLEGDMLCSVLTSEEHRARILGQSEQVRLLNRCVLCNGQ